MKRLFTFGLMIWGLSLCAQRAASHIEISSYSPENIKYSDLQNLDSIVDNRKVIGLGEATHGTHEFMLMRQRIFQYLVSEHDFNTVILEADFGASQKIDRYVTGKNDSLQSALAQIELWPWRTEEMSNFIKWIRKFNENNGNRVRVVGSDMQLPLTNLKELRNLTSDQDYKDSLNFFINNKNYIFSKKDELKKLLTTKREYLIEYKAELIRKSVLQYLHLNPEMGIPEIANYRDKCMANNILEYLELKPETKAIFIAHNSHVSKQKERMDSSFTRTTVGWYLKNELGNNYLSIAQVLNQGHFNAKSRNKNNNQFLVFELKRSSKRTLERYLSNFDKEILFVEERAVPNEIEKMTSIGSSYDNKRRYKEIVEYFDGFIYFNNTTPTHLSL